MHGETHCPGEGIPPLAMPKATGSQPSLTALLMAEHKTHLPNLTPPKILRM